MLATSSEDDSPSPLAAPGVQVRGTPDANLHNQLRDVAVPPTALKRGELQKNWVLLRKLRRATLIARQQHFPSIAATEDLEALQALRAVAQRGEAQKARPDWQSHRINSKAPGLEPLDSYAAPLSPLRDRDHAALSAWFDREDMETIAADIVDRLHQLLPEPCWEDNPFDFLKEFL